MHCKEQDRVYIYAYDDTITKTGSDDVASMFHDFVNGYLSDAVTNVIFFLCDGCAGQNIPYTLFRFFHHLEVVSES